MRIGIHQTKNSFFERWVAYCKEKQIAYKVVNCYSSDIIEQLSDCDALMWHHQQGNPTDNVMAKSLLFAIQHCGKVVFPDFHTGWHFDDKVGQKYLLESVGIQEFIPTSVHYSKAGAMQWTEQVSFPKVFKLRRGAGSQNVLLVNSRKAARKLISRSFGSGFSPYNRWRSLRERFRKYQLGLVPMVEVVKGIARLFVSPPFARIVGKERGYAYFQDFVPGNDSDIRVIVIDDKAFALKRFVRRNDFRASGSGSYKHGKAEFDEQFIFKAFEFSRKLRTQCVAYDFVTDVNGGPKLIEISYGFLPSGYDDCPGYWDANLKWHEGKFDPYGWMVELVIKSVYANAGRMG